MVSDYEGSDVYLKFPSRQACLKRTRVVTGYEVAVWRHLISFDV